LIAVKYEFIKLPGKFCSNCSARSMNRKKCVTRVFTSVFSSKDNIPPFIPSRRIEIIIEFAKMMRVKGHSPSALLGVSGPS
jgi:hypothetical protein